MKDFVNSVLNELKSDSVLSENSLVKLVIESTDKSIVNNDSYDNIGTKLKDSLIGINEHLKNKKIDIVLSQFIKKETTTDSILHEMSKVADLTGKLNMIKESTAYSNPIIKSKVDNYETSINSGDPEFRLYPSFISEFTQHIHESSVKSAVDQVINTLENKANDFEVLNTIHTMSDASSQTYIYESIVDELKKALAENKYSADIINLRHGESNLPLVTQLVNNLRIMEASKDGTFTLGAGNSDTIIHNHIGPSLKVKKGLLTYVDNRFMKISESTKLTGNETEVHINEQLFTAAVALLWDAVKPEDKKKIKSKIKELAKGQVDGVKKVTNAVIKGQLNALKLGKEALTFMSKSPANPLTWFSANEGFTIATMDPEFIKAKFPKFYNLSEAFASLGFVQSATQDRIESNSIRNFKLGLQANESRGLDVFLNDNKIDETSSINLTEALAMETPDVRNRVEYVFENLSNIFVFEFIKNITNDRLLSEATVFELGGNYIVCNKPNTAERVWNKVNEHQMFDFFNENFQYDISPIFGTKIDESIETKRRIEAAKTAILENINKLEGSVSKLDETIKTGDVDSSRVAELEKLKTSINESISKLKEDYINVDIAKSGIKSKDTKVDEGEMPAGLKAYHEKKKAKKAKKDGTKSGANPDVEDKKDDEGNVPSIGIKEEVNETVDTTALMAKYGKVHS
jgi:hypothetical protein